MSSFITALWPCNFAKTDSKVEYIVNRSAFCREWVEADEYEVQTYKIRGCMIVRSHGAL